MSGKHLPRVTDSDSMGVLDIFCNDDDSNQIETFRGVRYRYMCISSKTTDALKQINQFVITSDHNCYQLDPRNGNHGDIDMELTT